MSVTDFKLPVVFVVDDDLDVCRYFSELLSSRFCVRWFTDPSDILKQIELLRPEVVILDVKLGVADGRKICEDIRKFAPIKETPILLISGQEVEVQSKVIGFSKGADDYLVKPVHDEELVARVQALYSARQRSLGIIQRGNLKLNYHTLEVSILKGLEVLTESLTVKEYRLLALLVHHENKIVGRDIIRSIVWNEGGAGRMEATISSLRKKLGTCESYILNIPGRGLLFSSRVEEVKPKS